MATAAAAPRCRSRGHRKPIKLIGTGEKTDADGRFPPSRIAGAFSAWANVVSLVEKAAAHIDAEKAARVAEKMRKGQFDLSACASNCCRWPIWAASAG